jgi:probable HAF family extracellular repeat protein
MTFLRSFSRSVAAVACVLGAAAGSAEAAPRFRISDLGIAASPYASAVAALNRAGIAVGSALESEALRCAVFDHGAVSTLQALGGANCYVGGINDAGAIVGSIGVAGDDGSTHAFVYHDGLMSDLGTYPGYDTSDAVGINNRGEIVGNSSNAVHNKVFVYRNGLFRHIPAPPGAVNIFAGGINERGHVTGTVQLPTDHMHAFVHRDGVSVDLGTLGNLANGESAGIAINDRGQIAGWSSGIGFRGHAILVTDGQMKDLGTIPADDPFATSIGTGIDHRGWVVGVSDDGGGNSFAFLYDGKETLDLNQLMDKRDRRAWHLTSAQSINKSGEITGMAVSLEDGSLHVFLATPVH